MLTDLELHKRQNDDIAEVLNDAISLYEHFPEIGQQVHEMKVFILHWPGMLVGVLKVGPDF